MKHKKLVTLCVVLLVVTIAGWGWHTRWRKLPEMFQMDIQAETGFVSATSWYPFTENDRNTKKDTGAEKSTACRQGQGSGYGYVYAAGSDHDDLCQLCVVHYVQQS